MNHYYRMVDELNQLIKERGFICVDLAVASDEIDRLRDDLSEARSEIDSLSRILGRFRAWVDHDRGCPTYQDDSDDCTCGLDRIEEMYRLHQERF